MKTILVFEPHVSGHRMHYIRYILEQLPRPSQIVMVLMIGSEYIEHPQITHLIAGYGDLLRLYPINLGDWRGQSRGVAGRLLRQFRYVGMIRAALRDPVLKGRVSAVFIPFLDDYCHYALALWPRPFGPLRWGGIAIRPRHHLRAFGVQIPGRWRDRVDRVAYRVLLAKPTLGLIFSIDPYFERYYDSAKVKTIPDPADLAEAAVQMERKGPQDNLVLLVYGYVDERKGLRDLIEVASHPAVPKSLHVLIAGMHSDAARSLLQGEAAQKLRKEGRLFQIDAEIPMEEEAPLFRKSDLVWVFYPGSYCSSGALVRAGQSSRPVLATAEGLVGKLVADLAMGITAPEQAPLDLVPPLVRLIEDPALREQMGKAGFAHFSGETTACFGSAIGRGLMALTND